MGAAQISGGGNVMGPQRDALTKSATTTVARHLYRKEAGCQVW